MAPSPSAAYVRNPFSPRFAHAKIVAKQQTPDEPSRRATAVDLQASILWRRVQVRSSPTLATKSSLVLDCTW